MAGALEQIDGFGAAALRTRIEFVARVQQCRVTLSPPRSTSAWELLHGLICVETPRHFVLADDAAEPEGARPRTVLLPAVPLSSSSLAEVVGAELVSRASGIAVKPMRFLAGALPELVDNALAHGRSPTPPIACCFHDRDQQALQLIVCDLGNTFSRHAEAADRIADAIESAPDGGLQTLLALARHRDLEADLRLISGRGRVFWDANGDLWTDEAQEFAGFTAALTIPLA
jgi:anti-sigma regulatory factor (Ser/Thr protein kinase)